MITSNPSKTSTTSNHGSRVYSTHSRRMCSIAAMRVYFPRPFPWAAWVL